MFVFKWLAVIKPYFLSSIHFIIIIISGFSFPMIHTQRIHFISTFKQNNHFLSDVTGFVLVGFTGILILTSSFRGRGDKT